jgi:hypothetical protein
MIPRRIFLLSAATIFIAAAALLQTGPARGQQIGSIPLIAADTDVAGNTPGSLGSIDVCAEMQVGEQRQIDVVIQDVSEPGMAGFNFYLLYDERYIRIIEADVEGQMLGSAAASNVFDFSVAPNEDGKMLVAAVDFGSGADETGSGVLVRLTIEGVGAGTTDLAITNKKVEDSDPATGDYAIEAVQNGLVAVGVACIPDASPPPPATDAPTQPIDGGTDGQTEPPQDGETPEPGESPEPGDGASPATSASPSATGTGDGGGDDDGNGTGDNGGSDTDDDDGTGWLLPAVGIGVAVLALAGGAGFLIMRRRQGPPA